MEEKKQYKSICHLTQAYWDHVFLNAPFISSDLELVFLCFSGSAVLKVVQYSTFVCEEKNYPLQRKQEVNKQTVLANVIVSLLGVCRRGSKGRWGKQQWKCHKSVRF